MYHKKTEWDVDAVRDIFEQRDANLILSIPLPVGAKQDKIIWTHEDNGSFSVKSCYKALIGEFS